MPTAARSSRDTCIAALALAILVSAGITAPARAAFFTRILDPGNPAVNDLLETGGGAWADLDGDGRPELFVAHGNLTNQNDALYFNLGGTAFARVVTAPMASDGGSSIGGTWGDYDNDGLLDLYVTNRNFFGNFLYHATADTAFTRIATGPVATDLKNANSGSWVDLDLDQDLDLFVVNFQGVDDLYLNDGAPDYTFTAVDTGVVLGPAADFSIPGAWCDYDSDGDFDLFVGNAGAQNDYLYVHGPGLSFTRTILTDGRSTLGASWGDVDNDGDMDLFTTSFQNQVSLLYRNSGAPAWTLTPAGGTPFPANPGNAVGSAWGDFDNDGDLDLMVARDGQNNLLFVNGGAPSYALAPVDTLGVSADGGSSFGCGWADFDADGDLDLFVGNHNNEPDFLYRNDRAAGGWVKFRPRGTASNRAAIGARVRVRAVIGGIPRWQVRDVESQSGYNSQTLELHFGLGDAASVDSAIVRWPSGQVDTLTQVATNRAYELIEGAGPVSVDPDPGKSRLDWRVSPNPARTDAEVELALAEPATVELSVLDVTGRRVAPGLQARLAAGRHRLKLPAWSGHPGVYFVRLSTAERTETRRLVRLD